MIEERPLFHVCRFTSHEGWPGRGWALEQEGGDFFFFEAGEGAEFIDADIGPVWLIELFADAGQEAAGRSFVLARNVRHILGVDDNPVRDGFHKGGFDAPKFIMEIGPIQRKSPLRARYFSPYLGEKKGFLPLVKL